MCSAFAPDYRYDNSIIKFIGNVYCPNTMCSGILCVHQKTFQSLDKSDYQCPQCESTCHVRNILFEQKTISFLLKCDQNIYIFEETGKSIQDVIVYMCCPTCPNEKCVYISANRNSSFYDS